MIYDISPVNNYVGNDFNKEFEFDFYIDNEEQIKVYYYDSAHLKTQLILNVDYSVSGVKENNGGFITFPLDGSSFDVLKTNERISIELDLPVSQELQYNNSEDLNIKSFEYSFDYLTRLIQILKRKIELCVKVDECSASTPQELLNSINEASINCNAKANEVSSLISNAQKVLKNANTYYDKVEDFTNELIESNAYKLKELQITNCLTEIPNRINLDLTDGVLTLKKGSVVTVPNGVNVFDEITLSKDLSLSQNANNICTLFYYPSGARLVAYSGTITSGEGDPSYIGYNATTNKVLRIPSSGDRAQLSFPIAMIRMEGTSVTEILEVFDGFGYIGSTIWAERGVKGLIADGRNADGTCKNIAFETTKVVTRTLGSSIQGIYRPCVRGSNTTFYMAREPKLNYDNYLYASGERVLGVPFCKVNFVDGVVTSFEPYTAFRAIDFNEFSEMENVIETLKTEKLSATVKKSASGYVKLSNGIIIQWGQDTGHTTSTGTITLPTAFSSLHYVPIVTDVGSAKLVNAAVAESTTTFTWWQSGSATRYFNWIAIGY